MGNITKSFPNTQEMIDVFTGKKPGTGYARYFYREERVLEEKFAEYTGASAAALFNCGMAAITSIVRAFAFSKGKILASNVLYSKTMDFLRRIKAEEGVGVDFYSPTSRNFYMVAGFYPVKIIFVEVIGNGFKMPVVDLPRLMKIIKDKKDNGKKTILVIDNTFLTPALLKIIDLARKYGISDRVIVVESGTKYYQLGADDITLGLTYGSKTLIKKIKEIRATDGTYLPPLCLQAIPENIFQKQPHIMREHSSKAWHLVQQLEKYKGRQIEKINYPLSDKILRYGCGGLFYFSLKGGPRAVVKFCDSLKNCKRGGSFGHPDTWVIPFGALQNNGVVRVAVGWEQSLDEMIEDFKQALEKL